MNQADLLISKSRTEQRVRNERHKFSWFPKSLERRVRLPSIRFFFLRRRIFTTRSSKSVFNFIVGQLSF